MDKKDGTGEDYSLEILPETDFEEMDKDEEDSGSREFRLRRWQKVLLAVFAVIVIAAVIIIFILYKLYKTRKKREQEKEEYVKDIWHLEKLTVNI